MRTLKRTFIAMFAFSLCLGLAFIMPTKQAKADDEFAYEAGVEYDGNAEFLKKQETAPADYGALNFIPFNEFTDFATTYMGDTGYSLTAGSNMAQDTWLELDFIHPINSAEFETVVIGTAGHNESGSKLLELEAYNAYDLKKDQSVEPIKSFSVTFWTVGVNSFVLSDFADENGLVDKIVFRLTTDYTAQQLFITDFSLDGYYRYATNTEYDATTDYIVQYGSDTYNGVTVAPIAAIETAEGIQTNVNFTGCTGSVMRIDSLYADKAFVVNFVHRIQAANFRTVTIKLGALWASVTVEAYNVNEIVNGALGEKKAESTLAENKANDVTLNLDDYTDENGTVGAILFKVTNVTGATDNGRIYHLFIDGFYLKNEATVTFKDGETVIKTETVERGSLISSPETPEKTKEGYTVTFEGWFNGETKWNFETDKLENDVTLTAKFTETINEYSCTFTDVEENAEKITYTVDDRAEKLAALKEKLHEDTAQYAYCNNLPEVLPLENDGAYSETRTIKKYKVTIGNGEPTEYEYGAEIVKPADPVIEEKVGYESTFVGWAYGDGENDIWNFDGDNKNTVTGNVTLTARINEKIIQYTVTFVADGKEIEKLNYTVENKEIEEPAVPEKEGYTGAWDEYELTFGDVTVNAVYTEIPKTDESESFSESEKPSESRSDDDESVITGGCFGAVGFAGIPLVFCLAFAGAVVFKKKKD